MVTENLNIAECTAGRCNHTFEPPSNPPSSYDRVSVAAENVVGVGAARTCTIQPVSELIKNQLFQHRNKVLVCGSIFKNALNLKSLLGHHIKTVNYCSI